MRMWTIFIMIMTGLLATCWSYANSLLAVSQLNTNVSYFLDLEQYLANNNSLDCFCPEPEIVSIWPRYAQIYERSNKLLDPRPLPYPLGQPFADAIARIYFASYREYTNRFCFYDGQRLQRPILHFRTVGALKYKEYKNISFLTVRFVIFNCPKNNLLADSRLRRYSFSSYDVKIRAQYRFKTNWAIPDNSNIGPASNAGGAILYPGDMIIYDTTFKLHPGIASYSARLDVCSSDYTVYYAGDANCNGLHPQCDYVVNSVR